MPRAAPTTTVSPGMSPAVIHTVSPRGMGFGDVRLAAVLGMYLGWLQLPLVAIGFFVSFVLASVIGVGLIATGIKTRKDKVPFGPFLAAGTFATILFGQPLLDLYLRLGLGRV